MPYIDEYIMRERWRWMGHILRMEEDRIVRSALQWTTPGTRRVVRPILTWIKTMKRKAGDQWE